MIDFLIIILLISGVLQIIFFKVWGMTNDVRKIKNKTVNSFNEAHKQIILGNKDKAFAQHLCNLVRLNDAL